MDQTQGTLLDIFRRKKVTHSVNYSDGLGRHMPTRGRAGQGMIAITGFEGEVEGGWGHSR